MNTRRYPRTSQEAFPRTVDYACAITRPRKRNLSGRLVLAIAVAAAYLAAAACSFR